MRSPRKVDDNQPEIVAALRRVGASVQSMHTIGQGCPDLLVGFKGNNYVLEVKDGNKSPSRRALTPDEQLWHTAWKGCVAVVESVADAYRAIGLVVEGK